MLTDQLSDPFRVIAGSPVGAGFYRFLEGSGIEGRGYAVDVSPHNFFITVLLRGGIIGSPSFIAVYVLAIGGAGRASRRRTESHLGFGTMTVLLVGQLVYYLSYEPNLEQGLLIGLGVGLAAAVASAHVKQDAVSNS